MGRVSSAHKIKVSNYYYTKAIYKRFSEKLINVGKKPIENDDGTLSVKCDNCDRIIRPITGRVKSVISKTKGSAKNFFCDSMCITEYKKKNRTDRDILKERKRIGDRKYYLKNKDRIRKATAKYAKDNPDKAKEYSERHRNSIALYLSYANKISYAEEVSEGENGYLLVRCAYCNRWHTVTNSKIKSRIMALEGKGSGENRFYCSDKCKKECPIFNMTKHQKNFRTNTSREVPAGFRHMALEDKNWTCEKCGSTEQGLHVHHNEGYTEQPMFAADLKNVIVVCKKCHKQIHKIPGCEYNDYRCKERRDIVNFMH